MTPPFAGQHVVVTGATGELGGTVAELLLARGAELHLPVRSAAKLAPSLRHVHAVEGIDLADETAVAGFYRDLPSLWASLHCAGAFTCGPLLETDVAELEKMLAVNARTAFLCAREAARSMAKGSAGGRIVNVASRQALDPRRGAGAAVYTMSKAAVAALTLSLAEELAERRILVNAVAPSLLDTPENRASMPKADYSRWVKLEDAAAAMAWLSSRESTSSGAIVPV